ncbi:hypothetical protein C7N31_RS03420 [Enterococcus hirae]|uniref:hypothetical protein n=2 Tax=Enterococcus hirae TaxID=1354 RepID=UPI0019E97875|nr:hypothetical protein [Enterococcus hirae]EMF0206280.1 hypothetical protein [Enterococcus hirae]MCD5234915.1 hypothetical protein [Enterococcus hirae]GMB98214.1 hypothetical protein K2D_12430 [Enterococcus hirae]
MSDFYFVKLLPDVYDELKTSKYKDIILENLNRTYLALERNRRNWYIPIKSFTENAITDFVFPLPVMEEKYKNNRRCTPGFVFNHSLYLDSSLVIVTKDPGMELYRPFIEENKEKIIEKFYYFVSVAHHINARVKWDSSIDLFPEGVEYILNLRFNEGIDDKSIQSLNKRGDREGIETYRKKQLSTFLEEDNFIKFLSVTAHLPWQHSKITQNLIAQKPDVQLALEAQEWKKLEKKLKLGPEALYRDHTEVRFDKETKSKLTASFLVQVFDVSELAEKQEIPRPAYYVGNQTVDSFLYQILFQSINQFKNMPIEIQSGMNDKQTLSNFMRSAIHKTRGTSTDYPDQLEYFKSEAIGYILAKHIGLHTESYSFEYLSTLKKSELSDSKIDAILVSISRKVSQIYGRFRDNFNDILKKSMENDTVIQFQNNQSIELLDPVNKWRKRREASNERNQKRVDSIRLEEEKQKQHDPQVWIEVQTNSSERTNWNKDESKMQSPEEPNRENNSDYCREIESKQAMTVKEGDNRQSGDFKGKDKDDASLPLEKAEPSMNIDGNDQQSDNLKKSSETNPLWFEIGVWEPVIYEKEKSNLATNDLNSFNPSTFKSLTTPKFKEGTSLYLEKAEPSMNINGNDQQSDNLKKSSETNPLWFEIGVWEPVTYEKEKSKPATNDLNQSKYSPTTDKNTHQQQTVDQKRNKAMNLVKQQEKKRMGATEKLTR